MHEKDRKKILEAGFVLYRCSETEKVVKRRQTWDASWKIDTRLKTKKEVKEVSQRLLLSPKAIQD